MTISRYNSAQGNSEYQKGSRGLVLQNRQEISRKKEMDRVEASALARAQQDSFDQLTARTRLTTRLICKLHRVWLGGIYEWAGRFRSVELAKGSFRWPPAMHVAQSMKTFETTTLARLTPCRPASLETVSKALAEVHGEFLLIHPFRDGNGRMARWLANLMAFQANLPAPDYRFTGRGSTSSRKKYLGGVIKAYAADYSLLTDFFVEAFDRSLRLRTTTGFTNPRAPS